MSGNVLEARRERDMASRWVRSATRPGARRLREEAGGRDGAFTLIELMLVVTVIAIIAAFAIPALTQARKAANEGSAIASLRNISTAQLHYRVRFGTYATIGDLTASQSLDDSWLDGRKNGYIFACDVINAGSYWEATAEPQSPGFSGDRFFYIDASGVIRFRESSPADSTDDPID